jgi:hypothetical protein
MWQKADRDTIQSYDPELVLEQASGEDKEYLDFNMPLALQFDSDSGPLHRKPGVLPPS